MKAWLETRQVLTQLAAWRAEGVRCALATVVRVRGSAYRHEGAKLVVAEDGRSVGNVSGGCLEEDVRAVAARVIRTGTAERRSYCGGGDEVSAWDLGVGCEGEVEIVVEPVTHAYDDERAALAAEEPFEISVGEFTERLAPPPRLLVVSAGDDARHVARVAADVGFRVVVADRRPGLLEPSRFPSGIHLVETDAARLSERVVLDADSFAVVMTHHFADDVDYLRSLLRSPVRYLGVLGPRARTERILGLLRREGQVDESRIFGPVGLDIGTDGAEQVALAIVAEVLAVRSGRRPRSLRERPRPIHVEQPE